MTILDHALYAVKNGTHFSDNDVKELESLQLLVNELVEKLKKGKK